MSTESQILAALGEARALHQAEFPGAPEGFVDYVVSQLNLVPRGNGLTGVDGLAAFYLERARQLLAIAAHVRAERGRGATPERALFEVPAVLGSQVLSLPFDSMIVGLRYAPQPRHRFVGSAALVQSVHGFAVLVAGRQGRPERQNHRVALCAPGDALPPLPENARHAGKPLDDWRPVAQVCMLPDGPVFVLFDGGYIHGSEKTE